MTRSEPPDLGSAVRHVSKVVPVCSASRCETDPRGENRHTSARTRRSPPQPPPSLPQAPSLAMESPFRKAEGRSQRYRFSAPDIFSHRLTPQPPPDVSVETAVEQKKRSRSKSAPRVQTHFAAAPFERTPSSGRRGRESQRGPRDSRWRPEASPRREAPYGVARTHLQEVHPLKLQPDARYAPHYEPEDKPATSPHVRCRVDIKPDVKRQAPPSDAAWTRRHSRSLTVPRHFSYSRTPTPTESVAERYQYQPPPERRERRAHSSPNVPTRFFYADEPRYTPPAAYYPDRSYAAAKVQYVQDPRTRLVHAVTTPYYAEAESYPYAAYAKPYTANEPYIIQTPPARIFYGDDPRSYQIHTAQPRFYYAPEAFAAEHHVPSRAYYTEGRRHGRVLPNSADDWFSDASGYSTNPASYVSQATPTRAPLEPAASWFSAQEPPRIATDAKAYSRSWDNILNSERGTERAPPVHRGQSFDDLLDSNRPAAADKPQPVVVNLSSSPRRYAALSLSDNSLGDKSPPEPSKSPKLWFVTPEITITDNDLRAGGVGSASWDALDSRAEEPLPFDGPTKDAPQDGASLQQSLEQLDELLADLVTDYKPPSRRTSEDILDQLKKLIDEEEAMSLSRKCPDEVPVQDQPTSLRGPGDFRGPPDFRDTDGAADAPRADESPDQSPDEDDTMMCSNNSCRRTETLFNACLYFKSCHSCYTYYCSRSCRRHDWDVHKESCVYGRVGSTCRHIIRHCRETAAVHKAFSRIAKVGYLSRGRGVLFLGFPNPAAAGSFLQLGLDTLVMSPTYLSLRELDSFKDNLGEYCRELQESGREYDPNECFILNVSIAVGDQLPDGPSPRNQAPTVRKYAKVALASFSPERKVQRKESDMETLILTPPPGTADIDKEGEEGKKAREICFINIQRELRLRGVFLRHEFPQVYQQLCEFVENNRRFTPTTIYPIDKRTGKQFLCMIMAASEPRTLDWVGTPHLLDDII